jgi:putative Mn2+ efflux pump MntP
MDAFAVAVAAGLTLPRLTGRRVFRLSFHFGLFQFLMPVVGWLAGRTVAARMAACDHWIAFALLSLVGGKMLWEAARQGASARPAADPTRGWRLVTLSVATSIDALAVGLSLALLRVSIWAPSVVIGLVAGALTMAGMVLGRRLGARFGRWADAVGGLVLLGIGTRILISHLCE